MKLLTNLKRVRGKGRGKEMGIPTINFEVPKDFNLPHGVYAGRLITPSKKYQAAIHFGPVPQFQESTPTLEAYILDGEVTDTSDLLDLEFVAFIRGIKQFPNIPAMLTQIEEDVIKIKDILNV